MNFQKTLLTMLNVERESLKMSVAEWCRRADLSESTYYRWQNGDTQPNIRSLARLKDALAQKPEAKEVVK